MDAQPTSSSSFGYCDLSSGSIVSGANPSPRVCRPRQSLWAPAGSIRGDVGGSGGDRRRLLAGHSDEYSGASSIGLLLVALVVARQAVALREYRSGPIAALGPRLFGISRIEDPTDGAGWLPRRAQGPKVFLDSKERRTDGSRSPAGVYSRASWRNLLLLATELDGFAAARDRSAPGQLIVDTLKSIPESQASSTSRSTRGSPLPDGDRFSRSWPTSLSMPFVMAGEGLGDSFFGRRRPRNRGARQRRRRPRKYERRSGNNSSGASTNELDGAGIGIGLAIVDMVVRRHGAWVVMSDRDGSGELASESLAGQATDHPLLIWSFGQQLALRTALPG